MAIGSRGSSARNFRGNTDFRSDAGKGSKPTTPPASVAEVILTMIIHICKKSIFFDIRIKLAVYLGAIFLISLIADYTQVPKSYFSRSDNIFNQYFVKIGWFWTLVLTVPFSFMTSYTHCCGKRDRVIKGHLTRMAIATVFWYSWTTFFNYVEYSYGRCNNKTLYTKPTCLKGGHFWSGFDISGHCFILIYSSLILIEEAKAIIGWDGIREFIRDEDYSRSINDKTLRSNPLRTLPAAEFSVLKESYTKFSPYVRGIFIAMTALQLLWDVMLFCTLIYYHIMVEKFISGLIAILTWYCTYVVWYKIPSLFPILPGEGVFKYNKDKTAPAAPVARKRSLITNGKHFMGNPIYGSRQEAGDSASENQIPASPR